VAADSEYRVGTRVRVTLTFSDLAGAPADPTTVTLKLLSPADGTVTTYTSLTRESTGVYHQDIDTTGFAHGTWVYRGEGAGALVAVAENAFKLTSRFS
jgi:hypothetical protein